MVHAVRVPARNAIYFVMGPAVAKPGWTLESGAWLEVPVNAFLGMRGQKPRPAICQAVDDPLHYKVYMDPEQAEPDEWARTDLLFGGTFSETAWAEFARNLPAGGLPPTVDDPVEVAAYDQMLRRLGVEL